MSTLLVLAVATGAAAPPAAVQRFIERSHTDGASMDLVLGSTGAPTRATLDLKRAEAGVQLRLDILEGDKAGHRVLGLLPDDGTARFWVHRPQLGTDPVRLGQLDKRFHDLGLSLVDLLLVIQPERAGALDAWTAAPDGEQMVLTAPPDANGCSDTWRLPTADATLPQLAELCARGELPVRHVSFSGRSEADGLLLPAQVSIEGASLVAARLEIHPAATSRWRTDDRFDRDALAH